MSQPVAEQVEARVAPRPRAWLLGFLYAAVFLVGGCYLPYLPVWLHWRRPILIALAWSSLASFVLLWASDGFWQMLAASLLLAASWTTILPLVETVAVSGIRRGAPDYGKVRLWGSLSFIVASLGSGLIIGRLGSQAVLPLLIGGAALMVVGAPSRTAGARPGVAHPVSAPALKPFRRLQASPRAAISAVSARSELIQSSHAVYYSFGSLNWRAQGISDGMIGVLWSVGVLTEVALFAVSGRIIALCGTARLLMFAGIAAVFRWGFMAIDPPLWATALLQTLHAMSFGAAHIAAIHFLTHAVPEDRAATAQGLYAAFVAGLVLGAVTIASGPLYRMFAGEAYAAMALLALLGACSAFLLMHRWHGGLVAAGHQPHSSGRGGAIIPPS